MRFHSKLILALAMSILTLGPIACTSSSWCADCAKATPILSLNYQASNAYAVGTAIPVNPPNPSGGVPSLYEVTSGTLPPGLNLDPATGQITGTPTSAGVYTLTIRGTNAANTASQTIQITVVSTLPLALSYATPQVFPAGTAIASQAPVLVQATAGITSTFAVTSGSLPAGLTLNADGTVTGTPTTPGVYPFSITATNGSRTAVASATYTVTPVGSLGLNYVTPQTFTAGLAAATQSAALINPTPGVSTTYAVSIGSLPPGMSLNAGTGDITGTPTTPGVYPFSVTATNGTRTATSSPTYTIMSAAALSLSYLTPATFAAASAIATQSPTLANATSGVATTYTLTSGTLPTGLSLDAGTGNITGTPTTPGVFTFTVTVANGTRTATATATYTVVPAGSLTLGYTSPQTFPVGTAIATQAPTVTNPTPGVTTTFAVTGGSLPAGLTLNANGTITGTPTTPGTYTFTVTATNGTRTATATSTYTVNPQPPQGSYLSVVTTVNVPLTLTPQNLGGSITSATVISGPLPTGMTLNSDGTITGTPTVPGAFPFTVRLCDGASCMTTAPAVITVNASGATPLAASYANGSGMVGAPLSVAPTVTSGGPVTGSTLQSGSIPAGMVLNPDGSITGTPTAAGTYAALMTLTNASGGQVTVLVLIIVSSTGSTPLAATYPASTGQVGTPLTVTPAITSGSPVTGATLVGGVLPPGMTLNSNGTITGTPTQAGSFIAQVQLCNATGGCTTQTVQIDVNTVAAALTAGYANTTGTVGSPLSVVPTVTSGGPVVATTLLSGSLPPGLTMGVDGSITGTPTQSGTYTLELRLCNGSGGCTTQTVTITVNAVAPVVSPLNVTETVGAVTTLTPTNTGGAITSATVTAGGPLAAGLTLNANGTITQSGSTPAGAYGPYTVNYCNTGGCASSTVTIAVNPVAPVVSPLNVTETVGAVTTLTPANTGGAITSATVTAGGPLAAGLTLNANGTITQAGTTPAGTYGPYTVNYCNTGGCASSTVTIAVNAVAPVVSPLNVTETVGAVTTLTPTNTGGAITSATVTAGGPLAAGLTLNANGTITQAGTTPAGTYGPYTVNYCNTGGCASSTVTIAVNAVAPVVSPLNVTETVGAVTTLTPTNTGGAITSATVTAGGPLAAGLTLNANGTITQAGTTPAGTYGPYTVNYCNTGGCASSTVTIAVNAVAPVVSPLNVTETVGAVTTLTPTNTGGAITSATVTAGGPLAAGLTLNANGTITQAGTTPAGTYGPYTVNYCNTGGCASSTVTIAVNAVAPVVSPVNVTETVGAVTTLTPANTGGAITSATVTAGGPLAAGLTLNANGTITQAGTTPAGTYGPYTVNYCNTGGCASSTVTITVNPAANLTVSYTTPQTFPRGLAITAQNPTLTNTNPGLATTYLLTSGSLPTGLTLNASTGAISGTPTVSGSSTFTITATNGARPSAVSNSVTYIVAVAAPTSLNYNTPVTYTTTLPITSNVPNPAGGLPTSYAVTSGSLPTGLTLDPVTGIISGTPTVSGSFSVSISGTNTAGGASQTVVMTVLAYPTANLTSNPSIVPVGQSSSLTALFTGSSDGHAVITGDGISTPLTVTSGTSVPTGIVNTPGTTRTCTLTVTNAQGYTATSQTTVQWITVPSDTWTVTIPTAGGGPLTPGSGNLLNGQISITVPNQGQSVCGDVTLTVNKETALPGTIVPSAQDYSHTFNIASNMGYPFRVPITITLAYDPALATPNLAGTDLPMAFYWDPSYSRWVSTGLKAVDTTAHTVTFTTLLPGRYAVLGIPGLALATQNLGFASGTDDWRQNNPSVYDLPGGASLGMGSFASWYFPFRKASNGGVGLYNQFPTVGDANAAALISRLANGTMDSWGALWAQSAYALTDRQTGLALMTGLMVTGQPQVFLMADARPAVNNGLATAVYGYDNTAGKFSVMDPNYPGNALTITWSAGTGFSAYDRAAGYSPALTKFAFEGQTSIHRLADYDRVFSGADTGFPTATYATITITNIGVVSNPDITQDVVVNSANNVTVSGTVTNGDEAATYIYWSQNGSAPRIAVPLVGNTFTFTIPALANPYATTVALETTSTPCDPTFSHSGYAQFVVKQAGLTPWFTNSCFENGDPSAAPWTLQQGSNNGIYYPAAPTFSATTGQMNSYNINPWNTGSADSALVNSPTHAADPNVPGIASVLDGSYSFRVNNPANGAHISRMFETITVPTTVADPKLTFYWAGAMQSAGHTPDQLPYVDILVQDVTNSYEVLYYVHHYPPSTVGTTTYTDGYPGWLAGNGTGATQWFGINWQKVSLNLGASRQGHQLKITVQAADCTQTGHGGYAYIDNIGCN